jgi:dTDP-4-amino-4,6-dideoxygalactose transaminase
MNNSVFSSWPSCSEEEIAAVSAVLRSNKVNYWTGDVGRLFEKEFAGFAGCEYAVALANGTVALDLAFISLGIGVGDEVIVTSRTFMASVSSIVNAGARPVFADVCCDSQNITAESIAACLTPRTKAIVCVHLAGWPCDMDSIMSLAQAQGLYVIEDCAQAHGAQYKGRPVGSLGHVAAWSFCQDKIMSTGGEGGMLTTNDKTIWEKAWSYKDHGKSYEAVYHRAHPPGFKWLHDSFGTNWRLTEMQSAIGRVQLTHMEAWHLQRKKNALAIAEACAPWVEQGFLRVPMPPNDIEHAYYKFYVFVNSAALKSGWGRDRIIDEITAAGVPCFQGSCSEVYLEKAFEHTDFRPATRLPMAKALGESSLMFLVHPTLTADNIRQTQDLITSVMMRASH